jgi:hypothetical protein
MEYVEDWLSNIEIERPLIEERRVRRQAGDLIGSLRRTVGRMQLTLPVLQPCFRCELFRLGGSCQFQKFSVIHMLLLLLQV